MISDDISSIMDDVKELLHFTDPDRGDVPRTLGPAAMSVREHLDDALDELEQAMIYAEEVEDE